MMGMTGLSIGEVNKDLQGRIDQIKAESAEKARITSLDCARVLKIYSWANKYPSMVSAEKARLRAID